jgi:hypothetical protein
MDSWAIPGLFYLIIIALNVPKTFEFLLCQIEDPVFLNPRLGVNLWLIATINPPLPLPGGQDAANFYRSNAILNSGYLVSSPKSLLIPAWPGRWSKTHGLYRGGR